MKATSHLTTSTSHCYNGSSGKRTSWVSFATIPAVLEYAAKLGEHPDDYHTLTTTFLTNQNIRSMVDLENFRADVFPLFEKSKDATALLATLQIIDSIGPLLLS